MKWQDARKIYPNKWMLFEAITAHSEEGQRIIEELSVIDVYNDGQDALKDYAQRHKNNKGRELYVYNTKNEVLYIEERNWVGVRKNG